MHYLIFLSHRNSDTENINQDTGAGLVAAALISIVPGYISRSVAGSYDNEGKFPRKNMLLILY